MLFDCCSFFNELDILELRLRELYEHVDAFVIVEATVTHKGDAKPLYFEESKERFKEWLPKIRHVVVDDLPRGEGLSAIRRREMTQRNAILRGFYDARDDDIVLISDADEIPRPSHLPKFIPDGTIAVYDQTLHYYSFNHTAVGMRWRGTRACRVADARALSPHIVRYGIGTPDAHYPHYALMEDAGWHFSYFGDVRAKMEAFLHQELVNEAALAGAEQARAEGRDPYGRSEQRFHVGPAVDLPLAVARDYNRWEPFFADGWAPVFHEDWYHPEQAVYVARLAQKAPDGALIEIGAWEGRSAVTIAQAAAPRVLYVVDTWKGNIDEGTNHPSVAAAAARDVKADFNRNIHRLTAGNVKARRASWQRWIAGWDAPIAFLHLDAAHDEESVKTCLEAVKPFLVNGAILCGDDAYDERVEAGVKAAIGDVDIVGGRLWVKTWEGV